ncbi:MAG TPA: YciI family protein [Candidatus Polarisedimenticolaceae bacterium]|nr:YciI family protein [Candidatus Polarisedimenticolaceae bacterium]
MPLWVRTLLVTALPAEAEPLLDAHRLHLRELQRAGKLRIAGEFPGGDGFLEIFEADDRREAETIAARSPLVEAGQASWLLRRWDELTFD